MVSKIISRSKILLISIYLHQELKRNEKCCIFQIIRVSSHPNDSLQRSCSKVSLSIFPANIVNYPRRLNDNRLGLPPSQYIKNNARVFEEITFKLQWLICCVLTRRSIIKKVYLVDKIKPKFLQQLQYLNELITKITQAP